MVAMISENANFGRLVILARKWLWVKFCDEVFVARGVVD